MKFIKRFMVWIKTCKRKISACLLLLKVTVRIRTMKRNKVTAFSQEALLKTVDELKPLLDELLSSEPAQLKKNLKKMVSITGNKLSLIDLEQDLNRLTRPGGPIQNLLDQLTGTAFIVDQAAPQLSACHEEYHPVVIPEKTLSFSDFIKSIDQLSLNTEQLQACVNRLMSAHEIN